MNSTLLSTGAGAAGRLVLPAAVDAPAALVLSADMRVAQETCALAPALPLTSDASSFAAHTSARTRNAVQVPPPRGTPV